uniref:Uncharacterized protein n=1 Tax=Chaetoceros debilis TaxID=122233 RepID=A0A7S3QFH0_9STRA
MKFSSPAILVSVSVSLLTGASLSDAFTISMPSISIQNHNLIPRSSTTSKFEFIFGLQMASSSSSSDAEENDNLVTNEMFMREMLSHPNDDDDDHDNDNDGSRMNTLFPSSVLR